MTNLDYYINLDLMRMNVLPGALISFRAQSRFGAKVEVPRKDQSFSVG